MVMKIVKHKTNTMAFESKYTPLRHHYLVKKMTKQSGRGQPPPPPKQAMPLKNNIFLKGRRPKPGKKGFSGWKQI